MSATTRTATAVLALVGAVFATAALADKGPGEHGGQGEMFLEQFDTIDADKDGKITEAEIDAHRKAQFTAADTNGDGKLDAAELAARHLAEMQARVGERSKQMIEHLDDDGDGSLSAEELQDGPGLRHFARLDADEDGAISKAEAEAARDEMAKRFKKRHGGMDHDN